MTSPPMRSSGIHGWPQPPTAAIRGSVNGDRLIPRPAVQTRKTPPRPAPRAHRACTPSSPTAALHNSTAMVHASAAIPNCRSPAKSLTPGSEDPGRSGRGTGRGRHRESARGSQHREHGSCPADALRHGNALITGIPMSGGRRRWLASHCPFPPGHPLPHDCLERVPPEGPNGPPTHQPGGTALERARPGL
jgi:hypothetical protein